MAAQSAPRRRAAADAARQNFFPLAVGNSWTYTMEGFGAQGSVTVRVSRAVKFAGERYFQLEGYTPEPAFVRYTAEGQVVEFRVESGTEHVWYDFSAPQGSSWRSELPAACVGTAAISSRESRERVPAGAFGGVLAVSYGATNCADAGPHEEVFAPDVGLLRRTELTIGGPRSMVLSEARVGSREIAAGKLSVSLSIDRPVHYANLMPPVDPDRAIPVLRAELKIRNTSHTPLRLTTPSGQQFELVIRNEEGETVYVWSADKLFPQAMTTIDLSDGEKVFAADVPLAAGDRPLPPGKYTVEAWLTTAEPALYSATTVFDVQHVF